jgi:hypothetical protein
MGFGLELAKASAGQAASGIIGEGLGLITQPFKNRQQLKQAGKLQELQIKGSKEMTDYNMSKQLQMWKDTSYGAQVEQMNKAGINPALMYGMGGGGGQTAGSGGSSVSGQTAGTAQKSSGGEGMGLMLGQMGLMEADRKVKEADARLKNVEADKLAGVDTDKTKTEIASLSAGIKNTEAQTKLKEVETRISEVQERIMYKTEEQQVKAWELEIEQSAQDIRRLVLSNKLDAAQLDDKVKELKAKVIGEQLKNNLTKAQTDATKKGMELTDAQIAKIAQDISNSVRELDQKDRALDQKDTEIGQGNVKLAIEQVKANFEATHPGLWNTLGGVVERTVNWADGLFGTENWGKPLKKK